MPLAFPSHQGFVAPLWRRWPHRFHTLSLFIGAAMPDVVDGTSALWHGNMGQGYGHSLIGLFAFCIPYGLLLVWIASLLFGGRRDWNRYPSDLSRFGKLRFAALSVGIGAFSHLLVDFFSHGNFLWLYPWLSDIHCFPAWWYIEWTSITVPPYTEPYPIGPHFVAWTFLTIAGAVLLFRNPGKKKPSG